MQQFITITFQSLWQVPNPLPGLPQGNSASIPQACVMMFVLMLLHFVFRMFARFKVLVLAHQSGMQLACPRHLGRFCIDVIRKSFVSNFCSLAIILFVVVCRRVASSESFHCSFRPQPLTCLPQHGIYRKPRERHSWSCSFWFSLISTMCSSVFIMHSLVV